ncbi:MAG TPA: hypothetical protein VF244_03470 [Acidimicrobiales bacterium]
MPPPRGEGVMQMGVAPVAANDPGASLDCDRIGGRGTMAAGVAPAPSPARRAYFLS